MSQFATALIPFPFPTSTLETSFNAPQLTSDGGLPWLVEADETLGLCTRLAAAVPEWRGPPFPRDPGPSAGLPDRQIPFRLPAASRLPFRETLLARIIHSHTCQDSCHIPHVHRDNKDLSNVEMRSPLHCGEDRGEGEPSDSHRPGKCKYATQQWANLCRAC